MTPIKHPSPVPEFVVIRGLVIANAAAMLTMSVGFSLYTMQLVAGGGIAMTALVYGVALWTTRNSLIPAVWVLAGGALLAASPWVVAMLAGPASI